MFPPFLPRVRLLKYIDQFPGENGIIVQNHGMNENVAEYNNNEWN
jgi:hypothetical protein